MRHKALLTAALLCLCTVASFAADIKFPALTGRVVDETHTLSQAAVQHLTQELAAHEQQTGQQVVVAIVASLQGQEIEDYGYQLGRFWGIGQKDKNTGAILLVAPKEHKVRIEVGYGLEGVLTDARSNQIIYQTIIPAFKAGQLEQGIVAGTEEMLATLGGKEAAGNSLYAPQTEPLRVAYRNSPPQKLISFALILLFIIFRLFFGFWRAPFFFGAGSYFGGSSSGGSSFSGGGGSFGGGGASGSW